MLVFLSFTICSIIRIRLLQHRLGDWLNLFQRRLGRYFVCFSTGWVLSLVRAVSGLARRPFVSCWSQLARLTLLWLLALLWSRLP